ncbi:diguanylate cyclase [[Eubacterium] siraeum]|uniref:Stage 0 sporulation protein A homolog n=1 Tax=[Eubacterium] siraeum TaxID=39492 RepID=A0AAW6CY59_9FIRM|nr:diguanylate cyclase [[Eubacterium] siraeum]MDB8003906.1 diguanylate cyclase [[Eubacterium] siraeum]
MNNAAEKNARILIVDDSEMNRDMLSDMLSDDYDIVEAADGEEALSILKERVYDIDLVLLDIIMPAVDGFGVLDVMKRYHWIDNTPVIMISSETSQSYIRKAFELGVTDYILRPFDSFIIHKRVSNTLMLYRKQKKLLSALEEQVYENEKNNSMMINVLAHIVEFRNGESGMHVHHIKQLTSILLQNLIEKTDKYHLTENDILLISTASSLHDIGKISIDDKILNKPGRLTAEEFEVIKTHSVIGAEMLQDLHNTHNYPLFDKAYEICRWHHERYDGKGYPDGLSGEEIPISAQVTSLADVYDALTSNRCYKKAFSHEKAMEMILDGQCGAFNPVLLQCLKDCEKQILAEFSDSIDTTQDDRLLIRATEELVENKISSDKIDFSAHLPIAARERWNFFSDGSGEIQFEYDAMLDVLRLTKYGAKVLGLQELTMHPRGLKQGYLGAQNIQTILDAMQSEASLEKPVVKIKKHISLNGPRRWYEIRIRTLWSNEENPKYTGILGRIIDINDSELAIVRPEYRISENDDAEIRQTISKLTQVFDVVRLVDITDNEIVRSGCKPGNEEMINACRGDKCYAIWGKTQRCKNCVSSKAFEKRGQVSKLEFADDSIFQIISKYVEISEKPYVLEMIYKDNDGVLLGAYGKTDFMDNIVNYNRQLYHDALTGAYNRRYYEEQAKSMRYIDAVAMLDANNFKGINDHYGHAAGDCLLKAVCESIKECIRSSDILIRLGGDEFVLLMANIPEIVFYQKISEIKQKISEIKLPDYPDIKCAAAIGGVYGIQPIENALTEADRLMYLDKNASKEGK